jgi:hypothetical protein
MPTYDEVAALVVAVLIFVVTPALLIGGLLYLVISVRQLKDATAWMAWRMGGPAPRERRVVVPFRRRTG